MNLALGELVSYKCLTPSQPVRLSQGDGFRGKTNKEQK